jgi:DNA polymerase-3 subunit epsilon
MGHARPHAYRVVFSGADHGDLTATATTRERSPTCPLRHRAIDDCAALLHLLTRQLPCSKRKAMSPLLDSARKTEFQLWAENAPFEFKDDLNARGYRWDGAARCWYIVLDEAALPAEEDFLHRDVCPGRPVPFRRDKITARNWFSLTP